MGGFCVRYMFCCAVLCVLSSFAIIPLGERVLVILLLLSSECHVFVVVLCLFLTVPWVGMQCVTVEFPGHARLSSLPANVFHHSCDTPMFVCLVWFLTSQPTAMDMSGRSVHLTTLFPGQA